MRDGVWFAADNYDSKHLFRALPVFEFEKTWWNWRGAEVDSGKLFKTEVATVDKIREGSPVVVWLPETDSARWAENVKLSDEDARWLYPFKSHEETAAHILGLGAKLAVVTMGAGGAHLSSGEATVNVAAIKTPVADTIGAGDSFMSALILGFLARATADLDAPTLVRMGQMAAAAAAITVSRSGANPPSLEELEAVFCPAQRPDSSSGADTTIGTKAAATTQ